MKRVIKWVLIGLGSILGIVLLAVVMGMAYLNYEGPKTQEQKESLEVIRKLRSAPKPAAFSEQLPDVEPEIYDDRKMDNSTAEGHQRK